MASELSDIFSRTKAIPRVLRKEEKNLKFKAHLGIHNERVPRKINRIFSRGLGNSLDRDLVSLVSIMLRHNKPRY